MKTLNYRRILALVGAFSLLICYGIFWMKLLSNPDQRTGSDFMGVYVFGRIMQTKGPQHLYEIAEHQRVEEQVVGHSVIPIFYTHLPFTAPLAAVVVDEDYLISFKRWAVILLIFNALSIFILAGLLDRKKFTRETFLILGMGAFLFDPTFTGFINGQDSAIMLLGASIWMWGLFSENHLTAGLGLSLTTVRPQIALFLAIPFFFRYRKIFWGFVLGSLALAGISIWMLKLEGTLEFIESLRYIERTIWVEPHSLSMPTVSGIIRRNFTVDDPALAKTFVWITYLLGIIAFSYWWHRSNAITEKHIGLLSILGVFLLPYAHYHELTLILISIFCILRTLEKGQIDTYYLAVFPLIVSWVLVLGFVGSGILKFPVIHTVLLALGYILIFPEKVLRFLYRPSAEQIADT